MWAQNIFCKFEAGPCHEAAPDFIAGPQKIVPKVLCVYIWFSRNLFLKYSEIIKSL